MNIKRGVRLRIKKQIIVPNTHPRYEVRKDWKLKFIIDYIDSFRYFTNLNQDNNFEYDSQFAKWLFDKFGEGEYMILAWKKGHEGFWLFMRVKCNADNTYYRIPKKQSPEQIELKRDKSFVRRLEKEGKMSDEKKGELQDIYTNIDENIKIADYETHKRYGCAPYLKSETPVYKLHEYKSYVNKAKEIAVKGGFW